MRKLSKCVVFLMITSLSLVYYKLCMSGAPQLPAELMALYTHTLHGHNTQTKCEMVNSDPWDESILGYVTESHPINCKSVQPDFVHLIDGWLHVKHFYEHNSGVDDEMPSYSEWQPFTDKIEMKSDFALVECWDNQFIIKRKVFSNHFARTYPAGKSDMQPADVDHPSVIIFGLDSMSRSNFIRKLPKSYEYLTKQMGAVDMKGYTKIWDNTFANVVALLTGKYAGYGNEFERELVEERDMYYDNFTTFLWDRFHREHYVTYYSEDCAQSHMFNYPGRTNGFRTQPTDHYFRPFWKNVGTSWLKRRSSAYCYGHQAEHRIQSDLILDFLKTYKDRRKWAFSWSSGLSHEFLNPIGGADQDYLQFLQSAQQLMANNTIFLFLSDHGHRFDAIRQTLIGRLEVRMPFLSIWLSPDLRVKHANFMSNLRHNAHQLTTPFDLHQSLLSIIQYPKTIPKTGRSVSLFTDLVSENRSCHEANIPQEYCPCFHEISIEAQSNSFKRVAAEFLIKINDELLKPVSSQCVRYSLQSVQSLSAFLPNQGAFVKDWHGQPMTVGHVNYRIQIVARPNSAVFEAVLQHDLRKDSFLLKGDVNRNNKYGNQSWCIKSSHPELVKMCLCKVQR